MRDLLFLTQSPFSQRDYARFGIEILRERFRVTVLDCSAWLNPAVWSKYAQVAFAFEGYVSIDSHEKLVRHLPAAKGSVAVDFLGDGPDISGIRRELKSRGVLRAVVQSGLIPSVEETSSSRVLRVLRTQSPVAILRKLGQRVKPAADTEPVADIAVMSGTDGIGGAQVRGVPHVIWAHSFDYDLYLQTQDAGIEPRDPYAVFLDEDMVHHWDYAHRGIAPPTSEQAYYGAITRFFDKFEQQSGLRVVVAAHPRSRYDLRPGLWGARETVQGQTSELVRDAAVVFAHESTALSFVVLWRKPLIVLTTDDLLPTRWGQGAVLRSRLLKAPLVNATSASGATLPAVPKVDETAYRDYAERYIKRAGTPEVPLWRIVSDFVHTRLIDGHFAA